jgi:hypothetical protein
MTRIIVLLTLNPGKSHDDYLAWAKSTDLPTVNAFKSVAAFELFKADGLLNGDPAPYDYVEIIDIADMDLFRTETKTETMAAIAAEFREFATPIFIKTHQVG